MKPIKKILVPTDFSETALNAYAYALLLADQVGAEIRLLNCVFPSIAVAEVPAFSDGFTGEMLSMANENIESFSDQGLALVAPELKTRPFVSHGVEVGGAVPEIKHIAEADEFDLIVMGTTGAQTTWENLFGSNAAGVLHNAPCPVLIVPPEARFKGLEQLCFATDFENREVFAGKELVQAFQPLNPDLHIVHMQEKQEPEHTLNMELVREMYDRQDLSFRVTYAELPCQDMAKNLLEYATALPCDFLVMVRPHYSLFDQLFHKSYTREVALATKLPLLVLNDAYPD